MNMNQEKYTYQVSWSSEGGETIPVPLGERAYSGKFNVRTSRSLHRRLVQEARSEGVSLNAWINQKLASA